MERTIKTGMLCQGDVFEHILHGAVQVGSVVPLGYTLVSIGFSDDIGRSHVETCARSSPVLLLSRLGIRPVSPTALAEMGRRTDPQIVGAVWDAVRGLARLWSAGELPAMCPCPEAAETFIAYLGGRGLVLDDGEIEAAQRAAWSIYRWSQS